MRPDRSSGFSFDPRDPRKCRGDRPILTRMAPSTRAGLGGAVNDAPGRQAATAAISSKHREDLCGRMRNVKMLLQKQWPGRSPESSRLKRPLQSAVARSLPAAGVGPRSRHRARFGPSRPAPKFSVSHPARARCRGRAALRSRIAPPARCRHYPVQRHRLPLNPTTDAALIGVWQAQHRGRAAETSIPGVQ